MLNYSRMEFLRKVEKDLLSANMYQDYQMKLKLLPIRKGAYIYVNITSGIDDIIKHLKEEE